jgi:hypothetical protein
MRLNTYLGTSYHGLSNLFKDSGIVANSLAGVYSALVKCIHVVNRSRINKGFSVPHKQKSVGFKSIEREGHIVGPLLTIHRL